MDRPVCDATVFIVDDDEATLDALATGLGAAGFHVGRFHTASEFLKTSSSSSRGGPSCLILDVRLPGMDGLELQQALRSYGIRIPVIVISGHADVPMAVKAVQAGAVTFLEKPFREQELLEAVRVALDRDRVQRERHRRQQKYRNRYRTLTPRERQVMLCMVEGKPGKQIATELGISYKTVEKFRAKVMFKMQADSVAELVLMAVRLDLVSSTETEKRAAASS